MIEIRKRPIVIQDLIECADYIAIDNLEVAERFLTAAEQTFQQIGKLPSIGKARRSNTIAGLRQYPIKGFQNFLILYRLTDSYVEILRVMHGARNIDDILE